MKHQSQKKLEQLIWIITLSKGIKQKIYAQKKGCRRWRTRTLWHSRRSTWNQCNKSWGYWIYFCDSERRGSSWEADGRWTTLSSGTAWAETQVEK